MGWLYKYKGHSALRFIGLFVGRSVTLEDCTGKCIINLIKTIKRRRIMVRQRLFYFFLIFAGVVALLIAGTVSIVRVSATDNDDLIALGRDIFFDTHLSRPIGQSS